MLYCHALVLYSPVSIHLSNMHASIHLFSHLLSKCLSLGQARTVLGSSLFVFLCMLTGNCTDALRLHETGVMSPTQHVQA